MISSKNGRFLPDFIGIGAQRAGTTWLYEQLKHQENICTGKRKKEIHFFDKNFSKGAEWYSSQFSHCQSDVLIGELTPDYLLCQKCPSRIKEVLPDAKLIACLRNPIQRFYSQFKKNVRDYRFEGTVKNFAEENLDALKRGLYYEQLSRYYERFDDSQIHIIISEDMFNEPQKTVKNLFLFLGIDLQGEVVVKESKVNRSQIPRAHWLYATLKRLSSFLHEYNLDYPAALAKQFGVRDIFFSSSEDKVEFPTLSEEFREDLREYYSEDVGKLSELLDLDLGKKWGF